MVPTVAMPVGRHVDEARFRGRVAVVTGAADGIGAATAERLAREGAHVVVTDVDDEGEGGAKLAAAIRCEGGGAGYCHLDVCSGPEWMALRGYVEQTWGRLDVLHSNAGQAIMVKPAHDLGEEEWQAQLAVSLTGAWRGVRTFADQLRRARGSIVLTSSVHALVECRDIRPTRRRRGPCVRSGDSSR